METINIKEGRRYVTRNGLITEPLRVANNGTNYKLESKLNEPEHETPTVWAWKMNGRALADNIDTRLDIVAEFQEQHFTTNP